MERVMKSHMTGDMEEEVQRERGVIQILGRWRRKGSRDNKNT